MINKRFHIEEIVLNGSSVTKRVRIPNNYKKIEGLLLFSTDNLKGSKFGLKVDNKEIIPNGFHSQLIEFKGLIPVSETLYKLDIENIGQLFEFEIIRGEATGTQRIFIYLICEI